MPKIKYYDPVTKSWIPANPASSVGIDTTLAESGKAADAKVTGDKIKLKLDATKLPEAVNNALAQAKESGEFNGPQGDPGVVISDTEPVDKDKFPVWINPKGEGPSPDISLGLTGMQVGDTVEVASIGPGGVPTGWRKPGRWELIESFAVGYTLLTEEPADWQTNYAKYYQCGAGQNFRMTALAAPILWGKNKYFVKDEVAGPVHSIDRTKEPNGKLYNFKSVAVFQHTALGNSPFLTYIRFWNNTEISTLGFRAPTKNSYGFYYHQAAFYENINGIGKTTGYFSDQGSPATVIGANTPSSVVYMKTQKDVTKVSIFCLGDVGYIPGTNFEIWAVRA